MKLMELKACPQNWWKLMQCVHEISGIHNVSTNFVEYSAVHVFKHVHSL